MLNFAIFFITKFSLSSLDYNYLLLKHPQKLPLFPLLFGNTFALTAIESFDVLQLHEQLLLLFLPLLGQVVLIVNKSFSTPLHPLLLIVNKFPLSLLERPPSY